MERNLFLHTAFFINLIIISYSPLIKGQVVPPVTLPPVTVPPVTVPPVTVPPVTVPPVTVPPVTIPPVTLPPETVPPVTVPTVTVPTMMTTLPQGVTTTLVSGMTPVPGLTTAAPGDTTTAAITAATISALPGNTDPKLVQFISYFQAFLQYLAQLLNLLLTSILSGNNAQANSVAPGIVTQLPPIMNAVVIIPGSSVGRSSEGRNMESDDVTLLDLKNLIHDLKLLSSSKNLVCSKIALCLSNNILQHDELKHQTKFIELSQPIKTSYMLFSITKKMYEGLPTQPLELGPRCNKNTSGCPLAPSLKSFKSA